MSSWIYQRNNTWEYNFWIVQLHFYSWMMTKKDTLQDISLEKVRRVTSTEEDIISKIIQMKRKCH